ncbi:MAG: NAD-dependent epimerase/dehydratase [Gammaproteobacteria bacterium CG_4_10_14_0_8_um_filter_38_16]|nr:MAG: NAD-dependent epimerase/dehydratase [Gammaproteobacteria bacterium CG_4_10_14_0_8_um_filter_38_16]PJA04114.1 MAG: NAD-dependent epimerase/dehydratase [Gammaproteobacteria bacterium CG_4_10_14_0_2_um_filter_38_22]PJB10020.1 MAG: NAD-dependent epimerase/dehydratase [Gammaproteobacteria bacterium CG_4_9_14_3_um_filter_38_9]
MKILVTGGCGYKGTILVPKLLEKSYEVVVVDTQWFGNYLLPHKNLTVLKADIREPEKSWFDQVDVIIHLASVANDPCSDLNPKLSWEIGPLATMRLAEMAIACHVKQFIYASSGSVYGVNDAPAVTENLPLNPITEYNKTKMVAERVLLSYADNLIVQIVRPATVCGYSPRMRLDVSVNMMTMQALNNGVMTVFGGDQVRPNIHIDDITDLYLFLVENKAVQGIYNAGFENLSILSIAQLVQQYVKAEIKITPSNDPRCYRLCSDKLLQTGFKSKKTVRDAIQEVVAQFNQKKLKNEDAFYNLKMMKNLGVGI